METKNYQPRKDVANLLMRLDNIWPKLGQEPLTDDELCWRVQNWPDEDGKIDEYSWLHSLASYWREYYSHQGPIGDTGLTLMNAYVNNIADEFDANGWDENDDWRTGPIYDDSEFDVFLRVMHSDGTQQAYQIGDFISKFNWQSPEGWEFQFTFDHTIVIPTDFYDE